MISVLVYNFFELFYTVATSLNAYNIRYDQLATNIQMEIFIMRLFNKLGNQ